MTVVDPQQIEPFAAIVGDAYVRADRDSLVNYGHDALQIGHPADLVLLPADTAQIAAIAALGSALSSSI